MMTFLCLLVLLQLGLCVISFADDRRHRHDVGLFLQKFEDLIVRENNEILERLGTRLDELERALPTGSRSPQPAEESALERRLLQLLGGHHDQEREILAALPSTSTLITLLRQHFDEYRERSPNAAPPPPTPPPMLDPSFAAELERHTLTWKQLVNDVFARQSLPPPPPPASVVVPTTTWGVMFLGHSQSTGELVLVNLTETTLPKPGAVHTLTIPEALRPDALLFTWGNVLLNLVQLADERLLSAPAPFCLCPRSLARHQKLAFTLRPWTPS